MKKHVNLVTVILVLVALASLAAAAKGFAPIPFAKGFFSGG
ncbi:MAG TPA: hypothetical protein VHV52_01215 [Gaiellaceae bacterium]|jgi:uncharacterized protein (DUF697 family)|nr:hypothetical protein [Gaiellaceae bacterium]